MGQFPPGNAFVQLKLGRKNKHQSIIPFLGEDNAFAAVWPVDCGDAEENANVSKEDETVKD